MWIHSLNPTIVGKTGLISVNLGPFEIRWYGLIYVLGFFLLIWWLHYAQKRGKITLTKEEIWDLVFYLMVGVIIGSRLFEIFWEPQYYLSNFWNIFKIWQGGMSFHGGLVGIVIACWLYCRKKQLDFWKIADIVSVPAIFALALGRIANFINGELVGRVWNGKWCVIFPQYGEECRHPNMIYSFFQRMIVFSWLLILAFWTEFKPGFIFWNFVFWEGLGRFIVDFYREDILYYGFSLGQWFSAVMIVVALYFFLKEYRKDWKRIFWPSSGKQQSQVKI